VPLALWFSVVSALLSVVIIRIVLVTAQSYGLSQYALEMVVRVLVLELIPLIAAMSVALRVTLPAADELAVLRQSGALEALRADGGDALRDEVLPRALAGMFAVVLLAALSGVLCLVLAYLLAYGFSPWGVERYTRLVGSVFAPAVTLIFSIKTLAFAAAVSLIPIGSALHDSPFGTPASVELQGLVRMFMAILAVEIVSLVGNYY
jgi:phospholipid/cholesterol/gamma-HCH transport system permease protein